MNDKAITPTWRKLLDFFAQPVVFALLAFFVGVILILSAKLIEPPPTPGVPREAVLPALLEIAGTTILGAGAFAAVTKALVYGGIFQRTMIEVIESPVFEEHVLRILGTA